MGMRQWGSALTAFMTICVLWQPDGLCSVVGQGATTYFLVTTNGVGGVSGYVQNQPDTTYSAPILSADTNTVSQFVTRPFIWVKESDRASILDKIAHEAWAGNAYNTLVSRTAPHLTEHQTDRRDYLRGLPVEDWSVANPKMKTIPAYDISSVRYALQDKLNEALDCAILYYLTGDAQYASLAADVMHNTVKTLLAVTPSTSTANGGWVFQNDYLMEVRVNGPQLPIIYDFLRDSLLANQVYDYQSDSMVPFDIDDAQQVFRTLYTLARDHGQKDTNWSAIMSTTMLNSLLAIEDDAVRADYLNVYLQTGSSRQASLDYDYRHYDNPGDIWPESLQYADEVGEARTYHMVLLERIYPTLDLFGDYPNFPVSIPRIAELNNPDRSQILFGDGPRTGGEPYFMYELIYQHVRARGLTDLQTSFGTRIKNGVESGLYDRSLLEEYASLSRHIEPLHLLWSATDVPESAEASVMPRTDRLDFAGISLQRNTTDDPTYGLMCFVGGAGHVHSHASGMSMELYGLGQVMGAKSGAATYKTPLHEKYCRVYASNNAVIVNGGSRGEGGWESISINTVQNVAMEPQPKQAAVSANFSFTTSSFLDDKGSLAEATQQRTMGIVRTSPTSGFYVDIFRSDSSLSGEFHDYIYRNIGETNLDIRSGGSPVTMTSQPNRFQNDIGDAYDQPGWRYFTNTVVSPSISDGVRIQFIANMSDAIRCMSMYMPGVAPREIAKVDCPPMTKSPSPYSSQDVPAVVIRQNGEAWNNAFAVVYEPHFGQNGGTVQSVEALKQGGVVCGVKVVSTVDGEAVTHYVLNHPQGNQTYTDTSVGLGFTGCYGIVEHRENGEIKLYMGSGSSIEYQGTRLSTDSGSNSAAEAILVSGFDPVITANTAVSLESVAITGITPADDATNVVIDTDLTVTFNENISAGTGLITIKNLTDSTLSTIDITDGTQITISGATLMIDPATDLLNSNAYAIQIASGAVDFTSGGSFAGLTNDTTWNFSTVAPPGLTAIYEETFEIPGTTNGSASDFGWSVHDDTGTDRSNGTGSPVNVNAAGDYLFFGSQSTGRDWAAVSAAGSVDPTLYQNDLTISFEHSDSDDLAQQAATMGYRVLTEVGGTIYASSFISRSTSNTTASVVVSDAVWHVWAGETDLSDGFNIANISGTAVNLPAGSLSNIGLLVTDGDDSNDRLRVTAFSIAGTPENKGTVLIVR